MTKRQIKVQIQPGGAVIFDNAGNPDEQRILKELAELSQLLNGDPKGFKVEQHVHDHNHNHQHHGGEVHSHG